MRAPFRGSLILALRPSILPATSHYSLFTCPLLLSLFSGSYGAIALGGMEVGGRFTTNVMELARHDGVLGCDLSPSLRIDPIAVKDRNMVQRRDSVYEGLCYG